MSRSNKSSVDAHQVCPALVRRRMMEWRRNDRWREKQKETERRSIALEGDSHQSNLADSQAATDLYCFLLFVMIFLLLFCCGIVFFYRSFADGSNDELPRNSKLSNDYTGSGRAGRRDRVVIPCSDWPIVALKWSLIWTSSSSFSMALWACLWRKRRIQLFSVGFFYFSLCCI
jgi:hypothetical protein